MTTQAKARHMTKLQSMQLLSRLAIEMDAKGYNVDLTLNNHYTNGEPHYTIEIRVWNWRVPATSHFVEKVIKLPVTRGEMDNQIAEFINEINEELA